MGRQMTYITLTSDDTIDGCIRTQTVWDTASAMERLDLLADWQGQLQSMYEAEFKAWGRELGASRRDEQSSLVRHMVGEMKRLEEDNAELRAECFALAAGACGGHYGDDYGHSRCSLVDAQRTRAEAAEARAEALAAEVIRLRADNEQLRQRIEALTEANNAARAALEDDA